MDWRYKQRILSSRKQKVVLSCACFLQKQTMKCKLMSKVERWRTPQCIYWHLSESCLLWFLQSHQMCHLGQDLPSPGLLRLHAVPFHSPSCSTLLTFPGLIPAPLVTHLCPRHGRPTHLIMSQPLAPCSQSMHYFSRDFLTLKTTV